MVGVAFESTDRVLVETARPDRLLTWVTDEAAERRLRVEELSLVDENLESIFQMLVG